MRNYIVVLVCLLFLALQSFGQQLIPYLGKNGLYGYADQDGKVIVVPKFLQAPFFDSLGLAEVTMPNYEKRLLLPSGSIIPVNVPMFDGFLRNTVNMAVLADKVVPEILMFHSSQDLLLLQKPTHKYKLYLAPKPISGDMGFDPIALKIIELNGFYQGYMRVTKPTGVNFVNMQLDEVFPQDFADGVYVGEGRYIVKNGQNTFGVVGSDGVVIIPFAYKTIAVTNRPGVFILNYREMAKPQDTSKIALFNADTKASFRLDFDVVKPYGDYFLVQSRGKYGLIDHTAKVIVPCNYTMVDQMHHFNERLRNTFIFQQVDSAFVFGSQGQNLLKEPYKKLNCYNFQYRKSSAEHLIKCSYLIGTRFQNNNSKPELVVLDTALQVLFSDTAHSKLSPNIGEAGRFFFSYNSSVGTSGVLSELGREIVPCKYSNVEMVSGKAFLVKRDDYYGIFDFGGKEILPCKYEHIQLEQDYSSKNKMVIWAKIKGELLYYPFEMDGKPANYRPFHYPTLSDLRGTFPSSRYENGKFFQKTRSGKEVESSLINGYYLVKSGADYLYYKSEGRFFDLRNEDFERIVPKGYKALPAHGTLGRGLFVVVNGQYEDQVQRVGFASEAVSDATGPPPASGLGEPEPERPVGVKKVKGKDLPPTEVAVEEWGPPKQGVINSKGKWVLPPKVNGEYTVINKFLISERIAKDRHQSSYTLHKIGNTESVKLEGLSNVIPTKRSIVSVAKYLPRMGGGLEEFSCILDSTGREITPFNIVKLDHFHELGDTIVVIYRKDNGRNETVLMDLSARIVARIGPDRIGEVDKKRGRLILVNDETNLRRVADLQGRQVRKEVFKELDFRHADTGLFYIGVMQDGRKRLFNEEGFDVMIDSEYDSLVNLSNSYVYPIANREVMLACSGYRAGKYFGFSMLFDAKGRVLQTFPATYQPAEISAARSDARYLRFRSEGTHKFFYIDKVNRLQFRE